MQIKRYIRSTLVLCLLLAGTFGLAAEEGRLRPAGYAGLIYRDIKSGDMDTLKPADKNGLIITKVFPGSPAEKAGLRIGDILKKYDQNDISDSSGFVTLLRSYHAGDRINVTTLREGGLVRSELVLEEFPKETADGLAIEYASFGNGDIRLRAVIASPAAPGKEKLPALLMVSALSSPRLIGLPYYDMSRNVAFAAAKAGFRVMRFELRGCGDSEGSDYRTQDLNTEINDNLAALDYLAGRPDVDGKKIFIFGHSTGGQIAALLALRRDLAGLITSSTLGRTMLERSLETLRLQYEFDGTPQAEIDEKVKEYADFLVSLRRGESVGSVIQRSPGIARFVNGEKRIMDDRTPEYWKQQLDLNLPGIYGKIKAPVLIIHGTSDFLTMSACHARIRDTLKAAGNPDVTLAEIPDLDHRYAFAGDMKESFQNYKTGNFKENPAAVRTITGWLAGHTE